MSPNVNTCAIAPPLGSVACLGRGCYLSIKFYVSCTLQFSLLLLQAWTTTTNNNTVSWDHMYSLLRCIRHYNS